MSTTPGVGPGSSPSASTTATADRGARAYRSPPRALTIAAVGFGLTAALIVTYPVLRTAFAAWPPGGQRLADIVLLSVPLLAAVILAGRFAADGVGAATGIRHWRWIDPVLGLLAGVVVRAFAEIIAPTTGSLAGPVTGESTPDAVTGTVILIAGVVLVSPLVEELFFRGLVLRALQDALRRATRLIGAIVALVVSTAAFISLHVLFTGQGVPLALVVGTTGVGLATGILTIWTGRLGAAITAHVTFNAIGVVLLLT